MSYGYLGSMRTQPGRAAEFAEILTSGADLLKSIGCQLYVVGLSDTDPDMVWVSEVWDSKQEHDASLQLPEVKEAIAKAMPLLTGEFTRQELTIVGGLGV
jgi:quinol monooxygenase YgiN